ncbi:unnamed protein product, partial [Ascophyllum nodosum]
GVFPNSSIGKARRDINVTSGLISPDQDDSPLSTTCMRTSRTNTLLTLEGIVDGISWPARKWSRKRRMHVTSDKGCTLGPIACQNSKLYAAYGRVDKMDPIGAKKKAIT